MKSNCIGNVIGLKKINKVKPLTEFLILHGPKIQVILYKSKVIGLCILDRQFWDLNGTI